MLIGLYRGSKNVSCLQLQALTLSMCLRAFVFLLDGGSRQKETSEARLFAVGAGQRELWSVGAIRCHLLVVSIHRMQHRKSSLRRLRALQGCWKRACPSMRTE